MDFERYSRDAVHFLSLEVPELLREAVERAPDGFTLVDLGCGDGNLVYALGHSGLLERAGEVIGVDLSPQRIERFEAFTAGRGIVRPAEDVPEIDAGRVDVLVCTMVIEHVGDDAGLMAEVARQLRPGGRAYLSTVFKKPGAWYFRRSPDGRWVLDPTHVREYESAEAVGELARSAGLTVERERIARLRPPLVHPLLRLVNRLIPLRGVHRAFSHGGPLAWVEKLTVPIPRYRSIELLAVKPA
jgi:2-polyprenyl-3-methyl-5-hydroxy-6-metoxy-1,4-benzoquinol methylase